jgi:PH (Pleckstrin Homology) domain-containing protein
MVSFEPAPGEKIVMDEDCAEDKLKNGILVFTDKRLVFQKTQGRIATLSKKDGDVVLDIPLNKITSVKSEGFLVKKLVVVSGDQTYKFGVFSTGKWKRQINQVIGAS